MSSLPQVPSKQPQRRDRLITSYGLTICFTFSRIFPLEEKHSFEYSFDTFGTDLKVLVKRSNMYRNIKGKIRGKKTQENKA